MSPCDDIEKLFRDIDYRIWHHGGLESGFDDFSDEVAAIVRHQGPKAILRMFAHIVQRKASDEACGHVLNCLGHLKDPQVRDLCLDVLEVCLELPGHLIFDGALMGLARQENRRSLPALELALERITIDGMRHDIRQVIRDIEGSTMSHDSKKESMDAVQPDQIKRKPIDLHFFCPQCGGAFFKVMKSGLMVCASATFRPDLKVKAIGCGWEGKLEGAS